MHVGCSLMHDLSILTSLPEISDYFNSHKYKINTNLNLLIIQINLQWQLTSEMNYFIAMDAVLIMKEFGTFLVWN